MEQLATDQLADLEAEPQAVLEASDADSVEDVLAAAEDGAGGGTDEGADSLADSDADGLAEDLAGLFGEDLAEPEPTAESERRPPGAEELTSQQTAEKRAFRALERAIEECGGTAECEPGALEDQQGPAAEPDDPDVADALDAAEDVREGDLPDEIPFE